MAWGDFADIALVALKVALFAGGLLCLTLSAVLLLLRAERRRWR